MNEGAFCFRRKNLPPGPCKCGCGEIVDGINGREYVDIHHKIRAQTVREKKRKALKARMNHE